MKDRTEYQKKYKQEHKEQLDIEKNRKVLCECGGNYTLKMRARHFRTKKHEDFEKKQQQPEI